MEATKKCCGGLGLFGKCGRGTKKGCAGLHCRCMKKDCPHMHYVDCYEHYIHVEHSEESSVLSHHLEEMIEKLAAIEHERWADWQKWMHSKGIPDEFGNLKFMMGYIKNWQRQIDTPYSELSEQEKQSDRDQVMRYWPLIENLLSSLQQKIESLEKSTCKEGHALPTHYCDSCTEIRSNNLLLKDVLALFPKK